jgi:hypothetical protein
MIIEDASTINKGELKGGNHISDYWIFRLSSTAATTSPLLFLAATVSNSPLFTPPTLFFAATTGETAQVDWQNR